MQKDQKDKEAEKVKSGKELALKSALDQIKKTYGEGSIMKLGEKAFEKIAVIPTGSIALDFALGGGGLS